MPWLFDTDAVSELLKPKPLAAYLEWLRAVPREDQFISAVSVGELYHGAYRSRAHDRHLDNIENRVLPAVTVLPYDAAVAKVFGRLRAELELAGKRLADADLQIAATALHHGLELVTGNVRHFSRIGELRLNRVFADAKSMNAATHGVERPALSHPPPPNFNRSLYDPSPPPHRLEPLLRRRRHRRPHRHPPARCRTGARRG